jgi:hypothetical protein
MGYISKEKERAAAKRWRNANKNKIRDYNKRAYAKLPSGYQAAQSRKWRAANPEKKAAETKKYRQANLVKYKNYMRAWRRKQLIEPPPYEPPTHCEACGVEFEPTPQRRHCLDHCHITNRFRGWLCSNCNIALGLAGDTPGGVRKLLEYIVRAQAMLDLQLLE